MSTGIHILTKHILDALYVDKSCLPDALKCKTLPPRET